MNARVGFPGVPAGVERAIRDYADKRTPPGEFLRYVIANDLFAATGFAAADNGAALQAIARMVFNVVPGRARGSYTAVDAWINGGRK